MYNFTQLHLHTEYSVQDGASRIKALVKKAVKDGMTAIAITDHGNMFGTTEFYKECKANNIKPIIGCEVYAESIDGKLDANHLVLLVKNEVGYRNLSKLVSWAYDNFYNKPQVSLNWIKDHSEGLVCLSGCLGGEVSQHLLDGDYEGAKKVAQMYQSIFKSDYYLEIQRHSIPEENMVNRHLSKLSKELGIKLVATGDSHYTEKEHQETQEILLCLQYGNLMTDPNRFKFKGEGYFFQTQEEMNERFHDVPEALEATKEIEAKVDFNLILNEVSMPTFDVPHPFTSEVEYFKHLSFEGFRERFEGKPEFTNPTYLERLDYEIRIITEMGFEGYFLIVQDFIMYAKNRGIMVGPGRGSCVGSLVSYALKITDLDPIPLNLLFERFLNPERISNPDMDIDFEYERRDEVVSYVIEKYGAEAVSGIITFGTFGAKGVVRDVARVFDMPYSVGNNIAKAIPMEIGITLKAALEKSPELLSMYNTDANVKKVIDAALPLEGQVRHTSTHACGKVIAPKAIVEFMPEAQILDKQTKKRVRVSQMTDVEEMGLLKFDFLGLRTMSVIGNSIKMANKKITASGKKSIEYLDIPLTDWKVYSYLSKGETMGVFQLESGGMRQLMKDMFFDVEDRVKKIKSMKITKEEKEVILKNLGMEMFERLIAAVSLYRPGPLEYIPQYIAGMKNPSGIEYDCPEIEEILKPTYGTIVYQEQVQMIVRKLAGYSLGRGDLIRRAMGKKKVDVMAKEKQIFIHGKDNADGTIDVLGCIRNGISEEAASIIWDKMEDFAKYAFNKSHAAAYAMIAYITAWIKHYYPVEFMTAMLNSFISAAKKLKLYLSAAQKMGIEILQPDVNHSEQYFSIAGDNQIRFGLMGLKNMGKTSSSLLEERKERGMFECYQDLVERMKVHYKFSRKDVESIVFSSAADCFDGTRNAKISMIDSLLNTATKAKANHLNGQMDMFGLSEELAELKLMKTPELPEFPKKYKLEKEKEFTGFYVTEHPLDDYEKFFIGEGVTEIGIFTQDDEDADDASVMDETVSDEYQFDGYKVKFAGIIKQLNLRHTKDQKPLYTFTLEDRTGEMNAVIFTKELKMNQDKLIEDKIVLVEGFIKQDDRGIQIVVKSILDIEMVAKNEMPKAVWVKAMEKSHIDKLNQIVSKYAGKTPVFLKFNGKSFKASKQIDLSPAAFSSLQTAFGDNIKIIYNN